MQKHESHEENISMWRAMDLWLASLESLATPTFSQPEAHIATESSFDPDSDGEVSSSDGAFYEQSRALALQIVLIVLYERDRSTTESEEAIELDVLSQLSSY